MRQIEIEHLLFSQLANAERPDLFSYNFSRRSFLLGTGLLFMPFGSLAFQSSEPEIDLLDSILHVKFRGYSWIIDPRQFGSSAQSFIVNDHGWTRFGLRSAYFPGTNIRVDFEASLKQVNFDWTFFLTIPGLGVKASESLINWMSGRPVSNKIGEKTIWLGDQTLSFEGGIANVSSNDGLTLTLESKQISVRGAVACRCNSVTIASIGQWDRKSLVDTADIGTKSYSKISINEPQLEVGSQIKLCTNGANFKPKDIAAIKAEVFELSSGRQAVLLFEGSGTFAQSDLGRSPDSIIFEQAAALLTPTGNSIVGKPLGGQVIRLNKAALQLDPSGGRPLVAHFEAGRQIGSGRPLSVSAIRLPYVNTDAQVIFPENSPRFFNTAASASYQDDSNIAKTPKTHTDASPRNYLRIDDISIKRERVLDSTEEHEGGVFFNADSAIGLDGAKIELRRGSDLLNLQFRFVGFELRQWRRYSPYLKRVASIDLARIVVEFQPQHIWETVYPKPSDCAPPAHYSESAMSQRSRIVFQPKRGCWTKLRLTLENLLDWSDLELVVDERAKQARQNGVTDHIRGFLFPNLDENAPITTDDLFEAITSKIMKPSSEVTALSLADRLIFSPAEKSAGSSLLTRQDTINYLPITFLQQSKGSAPGTPLWNVRLDELGRKSVRAIWSDYLLEGQFTHDSPVQDEQGFNGRPLNPLNSREIVAQSSFYGMLALRRIAPDLRDVTSSDLATELKKIPRTEVVRPYDPALLFLNDACVSTPATDIGIAIPSTFDDADITLTSLGAMFDARWERDPARLRPAPTKGTKPNPKRPPLGYSLEQFAYQTALGRDIRVLAVRKGFLFPLGVRASFTSLVERYLFPDPTAPGGVVSYEMIRYFIECRQDPKSIPGFNQPYSANDFPTSSITMITKQTPDLVDPAFVDSDPTIDRKYSISRRLQHRFNKLPWDKDAHILWPRELGGDGSILKFQWKTDSGAMVSSPLVWVDNNYVGSSSIMKALVKDYYNNPDECEVGLRTAHFFGARQRYASESEEGETHFDTHSWELKARGQLLPSKDGEEVFTMDGRMEGAGQPPFYPWMDKGKIVIQSLDRMLGKPQGLITVEYHAPYRKLGFDSPDHTSEIYLKVLSPAIKLDVSASSNTTGGVATPNALVAAVSRKSGIVGGKAKLKAPSQQTSSLLATVEQTDHDSGFDFSKADLNKFDPAEFFGLGEAKLLGILSLKDIIAATGALDDAPKLIEKIGYGVLENNGGLDRLKSAAQAAAGISGNFFAQIEVIDNQLKESPLEMGLNELYPELGRRIDDAGSDQLGITNSFNKIAAAESLPDVFDSAQKIIKLSRPLIRELTNVSRNPLPPIADNIIDAFKPLISVLGKELNTQWKLFAQSALVQIKASFENEICGVLTNSQLATALFGVSQATQCDDLVRDPRGFAQGLGKALMEEQFTQPLAALFEALADIQTMVDHRVMFVGESLRGRALDLIGSAVSEVERYLDSTVHPDDIRQLKEQIAFARATALAAEQVVSEAYSNNQNATPEEAAQYFANEFKDRLETEFNELLEKIYVPNPPKLTQNEIFTLIKQRILAELSDTAISTILAEASRAKRLIESFDRATPQEHLQRVGKITFKTLLNLVKVYEFLRIAKVTTQVSNWCSNIIEVTKGFAFGMFPTQGRLEKLLDELVVNALDVNISLLVDPELIATARNARAEMLQLVTLLKSQAHRVDRFSRDLDSVSGCTDIPVFLDRARKLSFARTEFAKQLTSVISSFAEFSRITEQVDGLQKQMWNLLTNLKSLIVGATAIDREAMDPVLNLMDGLIQKLEKGETYRDDIAYQRDLFRDRAREIRDIIQGTTKPSNIKKINELLLIYAEEVLQRTISALLQSIALDSQQIDYWISAVARATTMSARLINLVHNPLAEGIRELARHLTSPNLETFLKFVIGAAANDKLKEGFVKVAEDQDSIQKIADAQRPGTAEIEAARELFSQWAAQEPAVVRLGVDLAGYASDFLSGKIAERTLENLKSILKEYKTELEDFVAQLIPTSIETGYTWNTKIEDGEIFAMLRDTNSSRSLLKENGELKEREEQGSDLSISVRASVDMLRGKRTVVTKGKLEPFKLTLLPAAHMATIHFEALTFESVNGASPRFDVKVRDVEIGPMLQFLEALKEWMSPSGNGFFLRPTFGGDRGLGIEAGFQFGTDLIQVGSLSFQNVYLQVATWLSFTQRAAQFTFAFASAERPFLISSPPYGGGGYVALIAEPGGRTDLDLAFVFGAVAAIKFGPLNGHGRIVVGFGVRTWKGGQTLKALFEAVGEGSIACFSISVSLRVVVYHYSNGDMYGTATFKFTFKVGFVKYRYRVRAKYRQGKGNQAANLHSDAVTEQAGVALTNHSYITTVQAMNVDYGSNQSHVDTSLI